LDTTKRELKTEIVRLRVTPQEKIDWGKHNQSELIRKAVKSYLYPVAEG